MASLLGTGVVGVVRRETSIELALVVSFRHCGEVSFLAVGVGLVDDKAVLLPAAGVLEKKPRMLCCLPVEGACEAFLAVDGVFAGVRAAAADFSPILRNNQVSELINPRIRREAYRFEDGRIRIQGGRGKVQVTP